MSTDQTARVSKTVLRILVQEIQGGCGRVVGVEVLPDVWILQSYHQALCFHRCPTQVGELVSLGAQGATVGTPTRWKDVPVQVLLPGSSEWASFRALAVVFVNARIGMHREHHRKHPHLLDPLRADYLFVE